MARTEKNSVTAKKKPGLMAKVKSLVRGKKATPKRAIKNALAAKSKPKADVNPEMHTDPAHSPGHRRLNLKSEGKSGAKTAPQNDSAMNNMARSDRIARTETSQRRTMQRR